MLEALQGQPALWVVLASVLGLIVGSFLNVVIHRLPKMMERDWRLQCAELNGQPAPQEPRYDLVKPRSACPACGHAITAAENVPVLSYLVQRGRCKACKTRISPRYPAVEIMTGVFFGWAAWQYGASAIGFSALALLAILIALAFIDADTQLLPDQLTLPLLWLGLLVNLFDVFVPLRDAVIGAMAGYLALWSVYWLFKLLTGKEGMGYGDFKLLAALGAWFGWQSLPAIVLLSSIVGVIIGVGMMVLAGREKNQPLPFGPYLAGAGALALFFGKPINDFIFSGAF
jgi:leader peptidase (prepilin peptidase)/N-methyltransferase